MKIDKATILNDLKSGVIEFRYRFQGNIITLKGTLDPSIVPTAAKQFIEIEQMKNPEIRNPNNVLIWDVIERKWKTLIISFIEEAQLTTTG